MRYPNRSCNDFIKQRQVSVVEKELRTEWIQIRIENLFDAGEIDFAVLDPGMVAMYEEGGNRDQKQEDMWTPRRSHLAFERISGEISSSTFFNSIFRPDVSKIRKRLSPICWKTNWQD